MFRSFASKVFVFAIIGSTALFVALDGPTYLRILKLSLKAQALEQLGRAQLRLPYMEEWRTLSRERLGESHLITRYALQALASDYRERGLHRQAAETQSELVEICLRLFGDRHAETANALTGLGIALNAGGNWQKSEEAFVGSLRILESIHGADHEGAIRNLLFLSVALEQQGKMEEARKFRRRFDTARSRELVAIAARGGTADELHALALDLMSRGADADAIPILNRAIQNLERVQGPNHQDIASLLSTLSLAYRSANNFVAAEKTADRGLDILRRAFGDDSLKFAEGLASQAAVVLSKPDMDAALALQLRRLAILRKALPADHADIGLALRDIGIIHQRKNNWQPALAALQEAKDLLWQAGLRNNAPRHREELNGLLLGVIRTGDAARTQPGEHFAATFTAAQQYLTSTAAAAVTQMGARLAAGAPGIAGLVRDRQSAAEERIKLEAMFYAAMTVPTEARNSGSEDDLRQRMTAVGNRIRQLDEQLQRDFPDYTALSSPRARSDADVRSTLDPDEALLQFMQAIDGLYAWVVTSSEQHWFRIPLSAETLTGKIAALRRQLDPAAGEVRGALTLAARQRDSREFNIALAHELYVALLGPAEDLIRSKKHIFVVASGPLTSLPFHVLVSEPALQPSGPETFRTTPWLVNRYAITTLPAVSSLAVLRRPTNAGSAPRPFIGFANPVFGPAQTAEVLQQRAARAPGFADHSRGTSRDAKALSELRSLPDTADEVRAIAAALGDGADLLIGRDASEAQVKRRSLDQYRVVHFATHGLVAGEVTGLTEPALALSMPDRPSPDDDGLLTASEVAGLKLNADWVILSACNTAAGDRPGAEALSGLARAFFYAGTRALLVSHWPVQSAAAVKLTTRTFAALTREPAIGRSEALRRAMGSMIKDGGTDAHPSSWGPFVIVGEGGAHR